MRSEEKIKSYFIHFSSIFVYQIFWNFNWEQKYSLNCYFLTFEKRFIFVSYMYLLEGESK